MEREVFDLPPFFIQKNMNYRNKQYFTIVRFPKGFEEERRLKCPPCSDCKQLVLASLTDSEIYKNDKTGVFLRKGEETDIVSFVMFDQTETEITNLGDEIAFPQDDLAIGFVYDWKQILTTYGAGCYKIRITFTISGIEGGYTYGFYRLREFSVASARGTVKMHTYFNSYNEREGIDFTGSGFVDSARFNGFFGNRQPKSEISTLISKGYRVENVKKENLNEYELRTDPLSVCMTRKIIDLHLLNDDQMLISDHNSHNHSYLFFDLEVTQRETAEVEYKDGNRLASIKVSFADRVKNQKTYYNQL